ncbi:MAG: polysaccharide deacetylase family protein [Lautropia sp.]|nr:polysaccharide deacetylase family protein [Lautropia sp.]
MLKHHSKQLLKRLISPLVDIGGIYDSKITRLMSHSNRLLVLMYHRVIDDPRADPFELGMCVSRQRFAEQLAWLKKSAQVLPLDVAVTRLLAGEPLPPRSVAITFDDGYRDNLQIAAPMLKQYELPATVYVVTGKLEENIPLWWDQVIAMMAGTSKSTLDTLALGLPELPPTLSLSPNHRRDTCILLLETLWSHNALRIEETLSRLAAQLKPADLPWLKAERMTPAEVQAIAAEGFSIGGHTVSHVDPKHLNRDQLLHELSTSRQTLQNLCQQPVDSFAYPGGRSSVWMPDLLAQAGFHHAVSTIRGINQAPVDRYAIARIGMPNTPMGDFKRAIHNLNLIGAPH